MVVDSWAPELICDDTWLTSEGNLDGLLEHVWLSSLLGRLRGDDAGTVPLSEEEHEKQRFRIWSGFCLCFTALSILECG